MSEEEIIKILENLWFDGEFFGIYYKEYVVDSLAEQAIQRYTRPIPKGKRKM